MEADSDGKDDGDFRGFEEESILEEHKKKKKKDKDKKKEKKLKKAKSMKHEKATTKDIGEEK